MGRIDNENPTGDLPAAFLAKMQLHWSKVQQAFRAMDQDHTGKIQRKEFEDLCTRFGCDMSTQQMDQVLYLRPPHGPRRRPARPHDPAAGGRYGDQRNCARHPCWSGFLLRKGVFSSMPLRCTACPHPSADGPQTCGRSCAYLTATAMAMSTSRNSGT